jgi:hypothetical protein
MVGDGKGLAPSHAEVMGPPTRPGMGRPSSRRRLSVGRAGGDGADAVVPWPAIGIWERFVSTGLSVSENTNVKRDERAGEEGAKRASRPVFAPGTFSRAPIECFVSYTTQP